MASARVEIVQPEPPPRKVILELTEEEAGAFFAVVAHCGGIGPVRDGVRSLYYAMRYLFEEPDDPFDCMGAIRVDARIPKLLS